MRFSINSIVLHTIRLRLIPLNAEQLRQCLNNFQIVEADLDLEISDFRLGEPVKKAIEMKLQKMAIDPENIAWYTYWLIIMKSENRNIGLIGFKGAPDEEKEVEIGYGLQGSYQGNGYMTEAAGRLVDWAFKQIPGLTVIAETNKNNQASQSVLQRLKFEPYDETELTIWWLLQAESSP